METSVKWIVERWKGDGWSYQEVVRGLWEKEGQWEWDLLEDDMGGRGLWLPRSSCWLGQSCLLRGYLLWRKTFRHQQESEKSEVSVQTGCIPEASLKA